MSRELGDPPSVRAFKALAARQWGEWSDLLAQAPRPSNYRSVLTYLKDHPQGYRKALNLIPRRLLSLYLVAYQSYLWNQIVASYVVYLLRDVSSFPTLTILDLSLPVYRSISASQCAALSEISVPLPGHRAVYAESGLLRIVGEVLDAEGLELNDLKARILERAYLPKGRRPLLIHPVDVASEMLLDDDVFPGRHAVRLTFTLPAGAFATLVLKRLSLMDENPSPSSSKPAVQAPFSSA